ncbi:PREDICTED: flotillin-2a-like, partial [Priapulus caudatus]|uniref:Flotillin-2a-like n=1 Tax=Priapulus caudatus TaxID=37621 RepID=A0ABM1F757_PRICU
EAEAEKLRMDARECQGNVTEGLEKVREGPEVLEKVREGRERSGKVEEDQERLRKVGKGLVDLSRTETVQAAQADAERIKLIGGSEATATEAVGKAAAERMRVKAAAYKQYGAAAKTALVLESLPK